MHDERISRSVSERREREEMLHFNVSVYCNLQGHYNDLSTEYNLLFGILFLLTGICITICSGYVIIRGVVMSDTLRKKQNTFVLSLVISDLLFGVTFIPVFVSELFERVFQSKEDFCRIRSWRVVFFSYLFSSRLLSILFLSMLTYIKTCHCRTKLDSIFTSLVRWLAVIVVWLMPAIVLIMIPLTKADNYKVVGTMTYVYYALSISIIIGSYLLTYSAISKAKKRGDSSCYEEAVEFVKGILIWFLITTLLIGTCGLILLVLAHDTQYHENDVIEHHVYIAAIYFCTLDAIANPVVYLRKFKEFHLKQQTTRLEAKHNVNTGYVSHSPQSSPVRDHPSIPLDTKQILN
ncbi:protein trapped in endoderm-1-like [Clytia hemisphaerica]|uniref:protein trapped in endoderm-1-like n=1 Tax=Clytia hemisphaerica TaxID=252671 RepID=UPI0034D448B0